MRIFIIGFGKMGARHFDAASNLFQSSSDIKIFDSCYEELAEKHGKTVYSTDLIKEFTADKKPELVIIASTASSHASYLKYFIENDVNYILCEKPVCVSLQEANDIKKIISEKHPNVCVAINHQIRFIEPFPTIKQFIKKDQYGPLASISIQAGNIGAAMNGTHYFEMFRFLCDEYPKKVWGWLSPQSKPNPRGKEFIDVAGSIRLESASGIKMYMDLSENQGHGVFITYTFKYGQLHIDELTGRIYSTRRQNEADLNLPTTRYGLSSQIDVIETPATSIITSTENVIRNLISGGDYPSLENATMAIKCLVAAYASSENSNREILVEAIPAQYLERVFPWA